MSRNDILITQILSQEDMAELIRSFNKEASYDKKTEVPVS